MRVRLSLIILIAMIVIDCMPSVSTNTSDSLSGYHRIRLRAHRRRHHQRQGEEEGDLLVEMLRQDAEKERINSRKTKNTSAKRERNEELCSSESETIELNNAEYEFDPPFLQHVRCQNQADFDRGKTQLLEEQTCVHGMLRCVQRYSERHVSRRPHGSHHWHPHILRDIPVGCDCMWPVDKYGHQEL